MLGAIILAFVTSSLLYEKTHANGFPELARYAVGGLLIMVCYAMLHPEDRDGARHLALACFAAGVGVGLARVGEALR